MDEIQIVQEGLNWLDVIKDHAKEVLALAILYPLYIIQMRENRRKDTMYLKTIKQGFTDIKLSIGKTVLGKNQIIDLAADKVKAASIDKLDFLRTILNKPDLYKKKDYYRKQIKAELEKLSYDYIIELNRYNTSIGLMGEFIRNYFPMESFLEEVYIIVFAEDDLPEMKIQEIKTVMLERQNQLWEKARELIN